MLGASFNNLSKLTLACQKKFHYQCQEEQVTEEVALMER